MLIHKRKSLRKHPQFSKFRKTDFKFFYSAVFVTFFLFFLALMASYLTNHERFCKKSKLKGTRRSISRSLKSKDRSKE